MARFLLVVLSFVLMGCGGSTPIADFSNCSVAYRWFDVGKVSGNHFVGASLRNTRTGVSEQINDFGWDKLDGCFVIWHNDLLRGQYKFNGIQTMACLGPICTNQINECDFGADGSAPGKVTVREGGVYSLRMW